MPLGCASTWGTWPTCPSRHARCFTEWASRPGWTTLGSSASWPAMR
ncbi:uncharacterized protein ACA1_360490 [Acanthamoeba castellanii str. Neff]|uniref:Uncharacterized protein n=1 Tax=Acanthamoeba castellanii (strain ATCC 30010 / Neff) TaxID=1257118 RepID=L8HE51_ACACF|nr:uncharacterized protein ACA1_360490 [Acanthamoeba castellanii str. Neff]ELR23033.1 hypothetical protein ACA1_360490 [Acanthamoeba castellanii str. Neff]